MIEMVKAATRRSNSLILYRVRTWRDGVETVYEDRRGLTQPFDVTVISSRDNVSGHATEIVATTFDGTSMDANTARETIGMRFLDLLPNFLSIKRALTGSATEWWRPAFRSAYELGAQALAIRFNSFFNRTNISRSGHNLIRVTS